MAGALPIREIRANYDATTIVVYQAFSYAIADRAVAARRFTAPFSFARMTWIKPSFLWMMARSGWARKLGQERVLAIRITRSGWEEALSLGVLSTPNRNVYASVEEWREASKAATVRIQWDPERSLRGGELPYRSIQVGIGSQVVRRYVEDWIVSIEDYTPLVRRIEGHLAAGDETCARLLLPVERVYPVSIELARQLGCP